MTSTNKEIIYKAAKLILQQYPGGIRYSVLRKLIKEKHPDLKMGTINGTAWKLDQDYPNEIAKPERGLFKWIGGNTSVPEPKSVSLKKAKEEDFYKPFADWLVEELDDCTVAVPIGGSMFKDKWGTPDVMGIKEPRKADIIQFPLQIVSAEIKTDTNGLITAFGQSCAYKLFSHKSYLVIPKDSDEVDLARMDSLCLLHGIGLIHFDSGNADYPGFEIRHRAARHEPDLFYANNYLKILSENGKLVK
jgi:hypothetical protein